MLSLVAEEKRKVPDQEQVVERWFQPREVASGKTVKFAYM